MRAGQCAARRVVGVAVVLGWVGIGATGASAQTAYKAANAPTSIVPRTTGFVHADFAEARLSLTYVHEFWASRLGLVPYAGAAARKGESDIFAAFTFNPGFEAGVLGFVGLGPRGSQGVVSLAVGFQSTERKIGEYNADSTRLTLDERVQRDLTVSANVNLALGGGALLGVGGLVRREWGSPGVQQPVDVCVPTGTPGGPSVPLCQPRYLTALEDLWAGQLRVDLLWSVLPLGSARSRPHLALIGASSVDVGQEANARVNLGAGVGVAPASYRGHTIVAVFLELYDVTDANSRSLSLGDKFVTRIVLGIPFALLMR